MTKILFIILMVVGALFAQSPTPTGPAITGTITYGDTGRPVPNAALFARWSGGGFVMTTVNISGVYELRGFQPTGTYTITPTRNTGFVHDAAISSLDAAWIAQFVAESREFTPLQILAADVSGDGTVSSFDAALAASMAIGIFPNHPATLWMFVPGNRTHSNITESIQGENYRAILLGDVTQNWVAPAPTPNASPTVIPMPSPQGTCPPVVCARPKLL